MGDIAAVIGDAGVQEGETFFVRKQPSWSAAGWYLWVWACVVGGGVLVRRVLRLSFGQRPAAGEPRHAGGPGGTGLLLVRRVRRDAVGDQDVEESSTVLRMPLSSFRFLGERLP